MKKYIKEQGYKEVYSANDLRYNQFYLDSVEYADSEASTMGNKKLDRLEGYALFIKNFEPEDFKGILEAIINSAEQDGVRLVQNDITVVVQEDGYLVTLIFNIGSL